MHGNTTKQHEGPRPQNYIIITGRETGQCSANATTATMDGSRWFQQVHPRVTGSVAFTKYQARGV